MLIVSDDVVLNRESDFAPVPATITSLGWASSFGPEVRFPLSKRANLLVNADVAFGRASRGARPTGTSTRWIGDRFGYAQGALGIGVTMDF